MPRQAQNPGSRKTTASSREAERVKHKVPLFGRRGQAERDESAVKAAGWHTPQQGRRSPQR